MKNQLFMDYLMHVADDTPINYHGMKVSRGALTDDQYKEAMKVGGANVAGPTFSRTVITPGGTKFKFNPQQAPSNSSLTWRGAPGPSTSTSAAKKAEYNHEWYQSHLQQKKDYNKEYYRTHKPEWLEPGGKYYRGPSMAEQVARLKAAGSPQGRVSARQHIRDVVENAARINNDTQQEQNRAHEESMKKAPLYKRVRNALTDLIEDAVRSGKRANRKLQRFGENVAGRVHREQIIDNYVPTTAVYGPITGSGGYDNSPSVRSKNVAEREYDIFTGRRKG